MNQNCLRQENIRERYFHDLVIKNDNIKSDLLSILKLPDDLNGLNLIHEDMYINGITADFTIVYNNQIRAIMECKAGDIGVTDYVRGIGQVLQYEFFNDKNISPKGIPYNKTFNSILLIPSSALKDGNYNIGKFKYPNSTYIVEINESSNVARLITKHELSILATVEESSLISISQYYIRDTRLFELYMLLRYLCFQKLRDATYLNRKDIEKELIKTNTINNRNWRNSWISLSSLGLINSNNLPTKSGLEFGMLDFADFLLIIYNSYIKPYVDTLMNYFEEDASNLNKSLTNIRIDLIKLYSGKNVLFLTQSETRYLSSWLNILRDDFGCLYFNTRSNNREINFNPSKLNNDHLRDCIRNYTIAQKYIKNLREIL